MKKKIFKRLFFCLLIIGLLSNTHAQQSDISELNEVENIAKQMFVDMNNRDFDAILNMTHPKVFEMISKEEMKKFLVSMFEGTEEFTIEIPKTIPKYKVTELFTIEDNNLKYAFVSYDLKMKMTFNKQEFNDEAKQMMIPMMNSKGMDVEFLSNNAMNVLIHNSITIVLKDDSTNNKWVMVNYDTDSPFFYQIVPSVLIEKSKEYKQNLMLEQKKNSEN